MPKYTAKTADKFILYQEAVQSAENETAFIDRVFRNTYGRLPQTLREDFCGTALICAEWVRNRRDNHAWGVDLCADTLAWGRQHNIDTLPAHAARRVRLLERDVRHVSRPRMDAVCALNFSYFIFKDRRVLVNYFRAVRRSLAEQGVFVLDAYGGWEAQEVTKDTTRRPGFTYIWEQAAYNPITDETICHITFKFPDGTQMRRAFTYDWRLWTLGGIKDALLDAGFRTADVYWEGTTKSGEGDSVYRKCIKAENTPGWNAYIVGVP